MSCRYCQQEGHYAPTCPHVPCKVERPARVNLCPECGTASDEYDEVRCVHVCEECGRRF